MQVTWHFGVDRTVMNVIHYPTPKANWTTFTELDKVYIQNYGIFTQVPVSDEWGPCQCV